MQRQWRAHLEGISTTVVRVRVLYSTDRKAEESEPAGRGLEVIQSVFWEWGVGTLAQLGTSTVPYVGVGYGTVLYCSQASRRERQQLDPVGSVDGLLLIVTLGKSETYKETIKEKSTILPYSIHKRIHVRPQTYEYCTSFRVCSSSSGVYKLGYSDPSTLELP